MAQIILILGISLSSVAIRPISSTVSSMIIHDYQRSFHFKSCGVGHCNTNTHPDSQVVASASFTNDINETGWSLLKVSSSREADDFLQAYWSGYLETNLTYDLTTASWRNTMAGLCPDPLSEECSRLEKYLKDNLDYVISRAYSPSKRDEYWYQILLQMWQIKGMVDAFKGIFVDNSDRLTGDYLRSLENDVLGIYLLQIAPELGDITDALSLETLRKRLGSCHTLLLDGPSCSALIKLVPGDVYISHVTWLSYCQMLRVLKHYHFPWKRAFADSQTVPGHSISFSSYPSVISSIDDFYITSAKLVTMETTNQNYNRSLWPIVRDGARNCVLESFRVMAANRLAQTGQEWVKIFETQNSGTYNNQWMIFDAKLYVPNKPLPKSGLLVVAEQLPGRVESEDLTNVLLNQTYWASYNLPYFPSVYNETGFPKLREEHGDFYDYHKTARAHMFRRDHSKVVDLASMYRLMRYNDYKHDPLSRCNCDPPYTADKAISSRSDLNDPNGTYPIKSFAHRLHGGIDVKITNFSMLQKLNMLAESGPTYDDVPPFDWTEVQVPVEQPSMQPTRWMFKPILTDFSGERREKHYFEFLLPS